MTSELFLRITRADAKGKTVEDFYALERLPVNDPGRVKLAWRLRKPDAEPHTVMVFVDGRVSCDCESATYHPEKPCKHVLAGLAVRILPKPSGATTGDR